MDAPTFELQPCVRFSERRGRLVRRTFGAGKQRASLGIQAVYRLVGTGDVEVRGNDPTGKSVFRGIFGPSAEGALACYDRVVSTRAPLLDPVPFTAPSGKYVAEETLFLPLSEDGVNVSKILVYSYSRESIDQAASWRA